MTTRTTMMTHVSVQIFLSLLQCAFLWYYMQSYLLDLRVSAIEMVSKEHALFGTANLQS